MRVPVLLLLISLLIIGAAGPADAADTFMGHAVYGYSGYSLGGALYVNAFPHFAEVSLDGRPIGLANDLQASLVDARVGEHQLTVTAPGYEPTTVLVRVVRDWTTRVRLQLIPLR
jgi:PEGA domain